MLRHQKAVLAVCVCVCALCASGCAKYYKVADPQSGRVYYTKSLDERTSGAVTLKDAHSGEKVTIQNSEVKEIDKKQFESAKATSGEIPPEMKAKEDAAMAAGTLDAARMAASPEQLRADLIAAKDQVDRTITSLNELTDPAQQDLKTAYTRYSEQVDKMKASAQQVKKEADAMKMARDAYFAKWDARIAATANPTIRGEAEAKRARLRQSEEKIAADAALTRQAYDPFITDLDDTRKFVSSDVSKDTVAVLKPAATKAQTDGQLLKQRIDVVIADLDAVEGKMASAGQPQQPGAIPPAPAAK